MNIVSYPSPNFNERLPEAGGKPDMIILHHTNMASAELALERLTDPASEVSCHYLIHKDGTIYHLVQEKERAWHAGRVSHWKNREKINSYSIGIEIDSLGDIFTKPQMESLVALIQDIRTRYEIPNTHILGHSDIAPDRKDDPSEHFDWEYLGEKGIGCMPDHVPLLDQIPPTLEIQKILQTIGYAIQLTGLLDDQTINVIKAFQRHFRRTKVDGVVDLETAGRMVRIKELF